MNKVKELEKLFIDLYINDNNIIGIFISGSLSNNSYDQYSDVDIRFIANEINYHKYLSEFKIIMQSFKHKVLFYEPCCFSNAFIPHFDHFIKADVFFYTHEMLEPSAWLKDIKIIKDQDDLLHIKKIESHKLNFLPSCNSVENNILKFFASSHECFRRIKRGEYLYANHLLDSMKFTIINFMDFLNDTATIGWYKAEKRFNTEFINVLNLKCTNKDDSLQSFFIVNELFLKTEKALCDKLNITRDLKNDHYILSYYIK